MTAFTDDGLTPDAAVSPDDKPNVHDSMAAARLAGYSWDAINGHLDQATDQAMAAGYTQPEVDAHLGYQTPGPLKTYLNGLASDEKAPLEPLAEPSPDGAVDNQEQPDERLQAAYAEAVQSGQVKGPQDFADHVAEATGSSPDAAKLLASMLPSVEDTTDRAIAIVHQNGNDLTPGAVGVARDNLMDLFGRSGITPEEAQQTTDPVLHDVIATPQEPHPPTADEVDKWQNSFVDPEGASINSLTLKQVWDAFDISKALGMPSFVEQEAAHLARMKEIKDNPGMYDANARLDAQLQDPALYVFGVGSIGHGVGVPGGPSGVTRLVSALDKLITNKDGNVEKVEQGQPRELMEAQMRANAASANVRIGKIVWKDQQYQPIEEPSAPGVPQSAKQQTLDVGPEKPTPEEALRRADEEIRAASKGEAPNTFDKTTPTSVDHVQKAQDEYAVAHIRSLYEPAEEELKAAAAGGAKNTFGQDTARPRSMAEIQEASAEYDNEIVKQKRAELLDAHRRADEELRAASKGEAPNRPSTTPTSIEHIQKAQEAYDDAIAQQKQADLRQAWKDADAEMRKASEGGATNPEGKPTTRPTSAEHVRAAHEAWDAAYERIRPGDPLTPEKRAQLLDAFDNRPQKPDPMSPEQHAAMKEQLDAEAKRVGIAPRKEPEPELAPPPELSRGQKNEINTDLDDELHRLDGRHEANIWRGQRATKALAPEWQKEEFQDKVHASLEKKAVDPTHEHAPDVQAFLDATKTWAERRAELAREHAELTGQDPKLVKTVEEGHAPRVLAEDAKPLVPGDPAFERDPITGGGGRGFTKKVTSTLEQKEYVLHNPETGERIWGGTDVKKAGLEFGKKVPADLLTGRGEMEVRPATTKEIDSNTGSKHGTNYWANLVNEVTDLDRANNHIKFLNNQMKELEKVGLWTKDKAKASGMKEVFAPQIKGYADPKIADTLNAFHNQSATARGPIAQLVDFLGKSSRYLMRTLFISPAMHALNVGAHWGLGRGLDWFHPMGYWRLGSTTAQAIRNVWGLRDPYINEIMNGSGHQYLSTQTRNFYRTLTMKAIHDVTQNPTHWQGYLKALGMPAYTAIDLANAMYRWSGKSLWFMNDVFLHQRTLELQQSGRGAQRFLGQKLAGAVGAKTGGMDIREAIFRAEKDIPNYRIPSQVLGSQAMAQFMKSPIFMNFGRYRYGQMRALALNVKDLIAPEGGLTAAKGFGIEDRLDAVAKLTLLYVGAQYGYPLINSTMQQMASAATGGADWAKHLVMRAAGPFSLLHAVGAVKGFAQEQKNYAAAAASFMTWGKALEIGQMLTSNRDSFTGKPVIDPKATKLGKVAQGIEAVGKEIYPLGQLLNLTKPNGLPKTLAGFMGDDVEKPISQSDQAKFDKFAQAQSDSRERKDPFEDWLRNTAENYGFHPDAPRPAAQGGSRGGEPTLAGLRRVDAPTGSDAAAPRTRSVRVAPAPAGTTYSGGGEGYSQPRQYASNGPSYSDVSAGTARSSSRSSVNRATARAPSNRSASQQRAVFARAAARRR